MPSGQVDKVPFMAKENFPHKEIGSERHPLADKVYEYVRKHFREVKESEKGLALWAESNAGYGSVLPLLHYSMEECCVKWQSGNQER